jgi:hypothetical protein
MIPAFRPAALGASAKEIAPQLADLTNTEPAATGRENC